MNDSITIIYDGQCPFCSSYVSMMRLRQTVGRVDLVDARSDDPRVAAALNAGLDLDEGMVAIWGDKQFYGKEAVHLLATLSGPGGVVNGLQRLIFSSPRRAALFYPVLARARRLFLTLVGRPLIANTKAKRKPPA
jgi:predicted DCC family thiol-disulfide oxidoreductase YuxK